MRPRPHTTLVRLAAALLLSAPALAVAQQPCDTSVVMDITYQPILGTNYTMSGTVLTGGAFVDAPQWSFISEGQPFDAIGTTASFDFPQADEHVVCLSGFVQTDQQGVCLGTYCEQVDITAYYPLCEDTVEAAFTILPPDGQTVTFIDQSFSTDSIFNYTWSFGDDVQNVHTGLLPQISNTFPGPGPYGVLLIVETEHCVSWVTNWIYIGPAEPPCEMLLTPDVRHTELGLYAALYDASVTSGMNTTTEWALGDGAYAVGRSVLHRYEQPGLYTVTCTTSLWGPLAPDSCWNRATFDVYVSEQPLLGVEELGADMQLRAYPQPFSDQVIIENGPRGPRAQWTLRDLTGRTVLSGKAPDTGVLTLSGAGLPPGMYLLCVTDGTRTASQRLVKQ